MTGEDRVVAVNLLACRLNSAALVYSAGNIAVPSRDEAGVDGDDLEESKCELYYYRFDLSESDHTVNRLTHAFPLSAIPFEFSVVPPDAGMGLPLSTGDGQAATLHGYASGFRSPKYVYGCSMQHGTFGAALGGSNARVDAIVKIDVHALIARGIKQSISSSSSMVRLPVDQRSVQEILRGTTSTEPGVCQEDSSGTDAIAVFALPPKYCASEPSFRPRSNARSEDDGYLMFYVFDEGQLDQGLTLEESRSELWVVDAKEMRSVVCRVQLPQRGERALNKYRAHHIYDHFGIGRRLADAYLLCCLVPYGLHSHFFTEEEILGQRGFHSLRSLGGSSKDESFTEKWFNNPLSSCISWIERLFG